MKTFEWGREVEAPCPKRLVFGYIGEYDTVIPHDKDRCEFCNPNFNMNEEAVVTRLRLGLPVVCDHNVYEAASRRVSAEQQYRAATERLPSA